jgi:hypothetical protein
VAGWARSWPDGLIKPDVGDGAVISVCMVMLLDLLWGPGVSKLIIGFVILTVQTLYLVFAVASSHYR